MTTTELGTPVGKGGRERTLILSAAAVVAVLVALYIGLRLAGSSSGAGGTLLPFQMLVKDLVPADQAVFDWLRQSLLDAESGRAKTGQWPEAVAVTALNTATTSSDRSVPAPYYYTWTRSEQRIVVNYLGLPQGDALAAAWLLRIQEPDPLASADTAPNDEEHHRLPDGTVLHVSIWMHRFGTQVAPEFFAKPENGGWTQLLVAPVNYSYLANRGTTR